MDSRRRRDEAGFPVRAPSRGRRASRNEDFAQLALENFALGVARQHPFKAKERLRRLVVSEHIGAMALKLRFFDSVPDHDEGVNARAWPFFRAPS